MNGGFVKVYGSILKSTVWQTPASTRVVWITMLVEASRDGVVEGSIPGLAHIAGVTIEECEAALATFLAPDKYSRTKTDDGRRIQEIDGGWLVLNHAKYRERQTPDAERKRRSRAHNEPGQCHNVRPEADPREQSAETRSQIPDTEGSGDEPRPVRVVEPVLIHPTAAPPPKKPRRGKPRAEIPDGMADFLLAEINAAREHVGRQRLRTKTPTPGMLDQLRLLCAAESPVFADITHVVDVRAAMDARGEGYGECTWEHICRPDNFRRYREREIGSWAPKRAEANPLAQYRGAPLTNVDEILARQRRAADGGAS